ncbi:MAG TPA: VWA domain-containing protein [Acidimicrobiia bacterium]|nr:VWA domain-containing protein [Acidimicrobiia bacterium]
MRFDRPWALLLIPVALAMVWMVARWGRRTVPRRQHRWAVVTRCVVVVLATVAAAGPYLVRSVETHSVLFLVDRSDSIGEGAREAQEDFLEAALAEGSAPDRAGIAVFGNGVRLDRSVGPVRDFDGIRTEVDGSATDLAGALVAAGSLLPSEGSRRVVVLTDAVPTSSGLEAAAEGLAESGVAVDFHVVDTARSADVMVETVRVPTVSRLGETATVTAVLRSNQAGPATVVFETNDGRTFTEEVTLEAGRTDVSVDVPSEMSGFEMVDVRVQTDFDTRPENDVGAGVYRILGPARVAVVEGRSGEGDDLARALQAGGLEVDVRGSIPSETELLAYDAVVLVNFPAPGDEESAALSAFVEDLGRGLVVVGGDQSFGLGDYHQTPLEAVLPVSSNPDDLIRRQPVAEVLVIDASGSMGACHCREGSMNEGGVVKTDIAKVGASAAVEALSPEDSVGVLAVAGGVDWLLPLQSRPDPAVVEEALAPITANGDTELARGLQAAVDELEGLEGSLRHIVLFTDGWDPNEANLVPLARQIADAGITLSVLGTGEGSGATLRRMADVGGGRFYPGDDLDSIPEIFVEETLTAARNLANEGTFVPALAAPSAATDDLEEAPPLLGYVATKAKPGSSTALQVGPGDPLYATWQRGLGRAAVWTSDATSRWATGWVTWDGFVEFWGAVLRDVLPAGRDNPPEVTVDGGTLGIRFDAGESVLDGAAVATVRTPAGETLSVPLTQTGESEFAASLPASQPGAYWVAVELRRGDGTAVSAGGGAVSGYAEEFAFRDPDLPGVTLAAEATGGRVGIEPSQAFDRAANRGDALLPAGPWVLMAALVLFLADVAMRRLVFSPEDATEWREGLRTERRRERIRVDRALEQAAEAEGPPPVVSGSETLERLMRRKRR